MLRDEKDIHPTREQIKTFLLCNNSKENNEDKKRKLPKYIRKEILDLLNPYFFVLTHSVSLGNVVAQQDHLIKLITKKTSKPKFIFKAISKEEFNTALPISEISMKNNFYALYEDAVMACLNKQKLLTVIGGDDICLLSPFILKIKRPKHAHQIQYTKEYMQENCLEVLIPSNCHKNIDIGIKISFFDVPKHDNDKTNEKLSLLVSKLNKK